MPFSVKRCKSFVITFTKNNMHSRNPIRLLTKDKMCHHFMRRPCFRSFCCMKPFFIQATDKITNYLRRSTKYTDDIRQFKCNHTRKWIPGSNPLDQKVIIKISNSDSEPEYLR